MPLIDGFNRHIDYLRISVTDRCNFRCVYCMPSDGVEFMPREELLTYDELERVVRVFAGLGIEKVRITGGEPTVRKDIVELVRRLGKIPLKSFAMTTNGYLLYDLAGDLKRAGLQRVNISLDTLRRTRFQQMARFDGFDQTWKSIWRAVECGFDPVKINMVVMKGINDDEILDFVELAREHPFHIRFIEYMPSSSGYGNAFADERMIKTDELKRIVSEKYELIPILEAVQTGPAKLHDIPGFKGKIGFIDPYADHFCSACNRVRLTSLGKLKWCLFSNDGLDVKAFIRAGKTDEALERWIRERILLDKPEHHPLGISEMIQVNTVFSQVGG
jgi:cyclic pyranopterin phosphate synthase